MQGSLDRTWRSVVENLNAHFPIAFGKELRFQKAGSIESREVYGTIESTKGIGGCQRNFVLGGMIRAAAICRNA